MTDAGDRTDRGMVWDHEDCPEDDCSGELQQQDRFNVMCLSCEGVWSHVKTETKHILQTVDFETVAEKQVMMSDGGSSQHSEAISPIDEYPLPMSVSEAKDLVEGHPQFEDMDDPPTHPDEFGRYEQVIARNRTWKVFAVHIYGHEGRTYVWNHQAGYGLRFSEDPELETIADVLRDVAEVLGA